SAFEAGRSSLLPASRSDTRSEQSVFPQSGSIYDTLYADHDYEGESSWVKTMVDRYKLSDSSTLLDLGCGTGRHLECLRTSFTVEGLDIDQSMLAEAARRLPGIPLHEGDFTDFDLSRQFDVVTCMLSSIGYARRPAGLAKVVRHMARHTRVGGVILIEPWLPPDQTQAEAMSARVVERDGQKISRMRTVHTEDGASILVYDYLVTTAEDVIHFIERHELGIFSREQYLAVCTAAGLRTFYEPIGPSGIGAYIGVRLDDTGQPPSPGAPPVL
ncbi:MAG: class I SAM-dependent DNA methyltransferase, partial [Chloroflexota bacterium]